MQNKFDTVDPVLSLFVFRVSLIDPFQYIDLQSRGLLVLFNIFNDFQSHMGSTSEIKKIYKNVTRKQSKQPITKNKQLNTALEG